MGDRSTENNGDNGPSEADKVEVRGAIGEALVNAKRKVMKNKLLIVIAGVVVVTCPPAHNNNRIGDELGHKLGHPINRLMLWINEHNQKGEENRAEEKNPLQPQKTVEFKAAVQTKWEDGKIKIMFSPMEPFQIMKPSRINGSETKCKLLKTQIGIPEMERGERERPWEGVYRFDGTMEFWYGKNKFARYKFDTEADEELKTIEVTADLIEIIDTAKK